MAKAKSITHVDTVIFDFDGVIADSFNIFAETLGEVVGRAPLSDELLEDLRGSSTREIIKKLDVKKWQMPKLITKGRKGIAEKTHTVKPFKGMPEAINKISKDYKVYILSTNEKKAIEDFLEKYSLRDCVDNIYSGTGIFGKAKRLGNLLRQEQLSVKQCLYVGDETRDVEAAHSIRIKCLAVGWGYSKPASLKSYDPDAFASKPTDLLNIVKSL